MSWVYWAPKSRMRIRWWDLLDSVIWRLLHDLHVMHMRLPHARGGDLHELRLAAHLVDGGAAGVSHACAQAAEQLLDPPAPAALVRDAALYAFRDQLIDVHVGILEVAVGRTLLHGAERAHAAIRLVRAALEKLDLAGRLVGAGEERAEHDGVRAGGNGLRDITRVAHAAVGDERHARFLERRGDVLDRSDLRHADARNNARGADRAGTDAALDATAAMGAERLRGVTGADVAADDLHVRIARLDPLHAVEHALRVAMRGIHHQDVGTGLDQGGDALVGAFADADRRTDAQLPLCVLARVGMLGFLQDVLHRDEALQMEFLVDHQHALQAVLVHELDGVLAARALAHGDELLLRRHDVLHRLVEVGLEAQVAVGDDADHFSAVLHHREAGDLVRALQVHHLAHAHLGRDGHRIAQHARLEALHLQYLCRLLLRREVLVHDADAAFLGDRDSEARLGDRVHGRRDDRDIQLEVAGEPGAEAGVARQDARVGGKKQNIVEGQRLLDHPHEVLARKAAFYTRRPRR